MAIAIPLGTGFTTVHALSTKGILPFGQEALQKIPPKHTVEYDCTEGGKIVGKSRQYITENGEASAIIAIANEGYIFLRSRKNIKEEFFKRIHPYIYKRIGWEVVKTIYHEYLNNCKKYSVWLRSFQLRDADYVPPAH